MKILMGMSGGVDSTYAVLKLQREGHTVEGAVLKMHEYTTVAEAEESARSLGIPLHVIDCRAEFEQYVVSDFLKEYRAARTPNPCVVCNPNVKFAGLFRYAEENGFDAIATGHYAEVVRAENGRYALRRAQDLRKDQTYMLWGLSQEQLSRLILPLSDLHKEEVRTESAHAGLAAADRSDSQEICFLPDGNYADFIEERTGKCPEGDFVSPEGKVLGRHKGIIHYTIGQRKGLGIACGERVFVTEINPLKNTVMLSPEDGFSRSVSVIGINPMGLSLPAESAEIRCFVKFRYAAPPVPATVRLRSDGTADVLSDQPVRAVTPGQSAVFYNDEGMLLFGGIIDAAVPYRTSENPTGGR